MVVNTTNVDYKTKARTDRIWLLHLEGSNTSQSDLTTSANTLLPSNNSYNNTLFSLHIKKPTEQHNITTSTTVTQIPFESYGHNNSDIKYGDDTHTGTSMLSQSGSDRKLTTTVNRDWRRTAQVMPSIDEFG